MGYNKGLVVDLPWPTLVEHVVSTITSGQVASAVPKLTFKEQRAALASLRRRGRLSRAVASEPMALGFGAVLAIAAVPPASG